MVMFLTLYPMESIYIYSFVLLEHLAMLLTSTLIINYCHLSISNDIVSTKNYDKRDELSISHF